MSETLHDSHIDNFLDIKECGVVTTPSLDTQKEIQGLLRSDKHSLQLEYFKNLFAKYCEEKGMSGDEVLVGATAVLGLHRTMLENAQTKSEFTTGEVAALIDWTLREEHFRTGGAVELTPHDLIKFCTDPDPDNKIINGDNNHNYSL